MKECFIVIITYHLCFDFSWSRTSPYKLVYAKVIEPHVCIGVGHTHSNVVMVAAFRNQHFALESGQVCKSTSVSGDADPIIIA